MSVCICVCVVTLQGFEDHNLFSRCHWADAAGSISFEWPSPYSSGGVCQGPMSLIISPHLPLLPLPSHGTEGREGDSVFVGGVLISENRVSSVSGQIMGNILK